MYFTTVHIQYKGNLPKTRARPWDVPTTITPDIVYKQKHTIRIKRLENIVINIIKWSKSKVKSQEVSVS